MREEKKAMIMINEEPVNDAFNAWLEKYGFSVRVYGMDYEFSYYADEHDITWSVLFDQETENMWNAFLVTLGLRYDLHHFWTSFLHEVGHDETMYLLTAEEIAYCAERAKVCSNAEYFELSREIIATKWAIDFIHNNIEAVRELVATVGPLVADILDVA